MGAEQSMVNHLNKHYSKIKLIYSDVRKNPDVAFDAVIGSSDYYFVLEVKKYNKFNSSNYPKQLLTEILINRDEYYTKSTIQNPNRFPVSFGIMLAYKNKTVDKVYTFLKDHITVQDWVNFGTQYNCKYIFLYDEANCELYFNEWNTFFISLNPILY